LKQLYCQSFRHAPTIEPLQDSGADVAQGPRPAWRLGAPALVGWDHRTRETLRHLTGPTFADVISSCVAGRDLVEIAEEAEDNLSTIAVLHNQH